MKNTWIIEGKLKKKKLKGLPYSVYEVYFFDHSNHVIQINDTSCICLKKEVAISDAEQNISLVSKH